MKQLSPEVSRKIEYAAYAAMAIAAVGVAIWLTRPAPKVTTTQSRLTISPGFRLGQPIDWAAHDRTLVFALQTGCHFCAESAPFYRRLSAMVEESPRLHLTAVLPQTIAQSKQYLTKMGINISDVRQGNLVSLRVSGTPTLILVDSGGIVRKVWVGKLTAEGESQVMAILGLAHPPQPN